MVKILMVHTDDTASSIAKKGGLGDFGLDRKKAAKCEYIVAVNRSGEGQGDAFFIGKISKISDVKNTSFGQYGNPRAIVRVSEGCAVNIPGLWPQFSVPIAYRTAEDLGIDISSLHFVPIKELSAAGDSISTAASTNAVAELTVQQAKKALAKKFGVAVSAIRITIET